MTRSILIPLLASVVWILTVFSSAAQSAEQPGLNGGSLNAIAPASNQSLNAIINEPSISSRVLGGGDSEPGEWPSVVALVRTGLFPLENRLFCGGTIVAQRWVMTAAHCLFDPFGEQIQPTSIRVIAGITDLRNEFPDEETIVSNIVVHPQYVHSVDQLISFDIALLELGSSLALPAVTLFAEDTEDYAGTPGFIAGWGAIQYINENNAVFPSRLQDATVPLVSNETCNDPQSYDGAIVDNQLCAGFEEGGVDSCAGDSGGPLFIVQNGQQVQVGITGFGNGCALPLFYGIYTNVSHFIPWLSNYIDVPFQSPELIASRQASVPVASASSDRRGFFGGSLHPIVLLLLSLIPGLRGVQCLAFPEALMKNERLRIHARLMPLMKTEKRSVKRKFSVILVGIVLTSAIASCAIANDPPSKNVFLANDNGRAGVHTERLGDDYESVIARLNASHKDLPECVSSAVAIRGTGRLSTQVQCTASSDSATGKLDASIQKIDYVFLDDQLVRIDVTLDPETLASLTDTLNARYQSLITTSPDLLEWRSDGNSAQDHVRLISESEALAGNAPSMRLQFIDGRLETRMPSLFATF